MTTATHTSFVVEAIDLRDPDGNVRPEVWECQTSEEAAVRFDSELECGIEEVAEMLEAPGSFFRMIDFEAGLEVIARRVS